MVEHTAQVVPISQDVLPRTNTEQEMLDFVAIQLQNYRSDYGCSPVTIAVVLIGEDDANGYTDANSWSPTNEQRSRLQACATAAAVLWKRALGL